MNTPSTDIVASPTGYIPAIHDYEANKIIRNYTVAATASGFIPSSIISAAGVTGIQVLMIRELCRLYELPFTQRRVQVFLNAVLGSFATRLAAMAATTLPGVHTPMRGLSGAAIASLHTATVGEFYKIHFQNGGYLENASLKDFSRYIIEAFKRGDISLGNMTNPIGILKGMLSSEERS